MASSTRAMASMMPLASTAGRLAPGARAATRAFSNMPRASKTMALRPLARPTACLKLNTTGRIAFRRAYADEAPKPKPGKLRRTLRWTWRITYLSVFGLLGYTCYEIYQDRHPEEQFHRDPNKKTLVVLGQLHPPTPAQCRAVTQS